MANGLLGAIANPTQANVVGQFQLGQQQNLQQEQQQFALQQQQDQIAKQQEVQQLAGEILGQTVGGKLADLADVDPQAAIEIANGLGVPLDQPGRLKNLFGTAQIANSIANSVGPEAALSFIQGERTKIQSFGIETPIMDQLTQQFEQDPAAGVAGLAQFVQSGMDAGILKSQGRVSEKEKAQTAKLTAETEQIEVETFDKIAARAKKPGKVGFKDFRGLNNDVTTLLKKPGAIRRAANSLIKLGQTKSPTDQLAAIFTFMKALDPDSVVREGEQRQAASTGGVAEAFVGFINKARGAGGLPTTVFNQMIATAKRLSNQATEGATSELGSSLDAFGDRLSDEDKSRLLNRIEKPFDIEGPVVAPPEPFDVNAKPIAVRGNQELLRVTREKGDQ